MSLRHAGARPRAEAEAGTAPISTAESEAEQTTKRCEERSVAASLGGAGGSCSRDPPPGHGWLGGGGGLNCQVLLGRCAVCQAELCRGFNLRDLPALAKLGDRLTALQAPSPELARARPAHPGPPTSAQVSGSDLLRAGVAFSDLGVLHPPIFQSIAKAIQGTVCIEFRLHFHAKARRCSAPGRIPSPPPMLRSWPEWLGSAESVYTETPVTQL